MKLNVLFNATSLDDLLILINKHFGIPMKTFRINMSMFEQYEIRPVQRVFVPRIWSYRILASKGYYYFGTL